jgi:hypothetical protein
MNNFTAENLARQSRNQKRGENRKERKVRIKKSKCRGRFQTRPLQRFGMPENLRKPRKLSRIAMQSTQSFFYIKNSLLRALSVSVVN